MPSPKRTLRRAALAVRQWRTDHETEILQQFTTLFSIPNVASDRETIGHNADLLKSMGQKRGADSQLLSGRAHGNGVIRYGVPS